MLLGETPLNLVVVGKPHVGLDGDAFASRSAALSSLDRRSAALFEAINNAARSTGGTVDQTWSVAPAAHVKGTADTVEALAKIDDVIRIEHDAPDAVRLIDPIPDPISDEGLTPSNTTGRKMLQAEDIWALGFRGEGIKLAVIDTGIYPSHEAFKNTDGSSRITAWKDWVANQTTPYDDQGHGTHVAGTAAGSALFTDPTFGLYQEEGMAPRAQLLVSKFLNSSGSGSFENAINSLNWAYTNGADITSNSWGGSCSGSLAVIQTVRQTTDLGMLSVFAAGNSGPGSGTIGGPACGESSLTIGAVDANKNIASFSSRGPCSDPDTGTGSRICPDLVAKGVSVRSAAGRTTCSLCDGTGYKVLNGTSMATPHAAGAVVLAEQMKRFYTGTGWDTAARAEEAVFKLTSLDLGPAGEDSTFGWGLPQLLNIYTLLNASDDAVIIDTFGITAPVVRLGDSTTLTFSVRNLGGAVATGQFNATLTDPLGAVTTLKSSTPSLGLLDGESATHVMRVSGSLRPGDYLFKGSFNYSWLDPNGDTQTGSILREGIIKVARAFIQMTLAGLAPTTTPLGLQQVAFTATNTGNEGAGAVRIEVTVPDDYVFLPGANFNPTDLKTRYSNPAPSTVVEDRTFGRVTLIYNVGTMAVGAMFGFTATLVPTLPGSYRTLSVAKFTDGAGKSFAQGSSTVQTVALPA